MRNYCFNLLKDQKKYSNFFIKPANDVLYLTSRDKRDDIPAIFNHPDYSEYVLEDIHVTVLEHFEISRKSAESRFNTICPFHATVRFRHPVSGFTIVIHDFYRAIDLSRFFHIQHHTGDSSITYLPQHVINLSDLDILIKQEIELIEELIETNNQHEQGLLRSIDTTYEQLFMIATQSNNFPETMEKSDYDKFIVSLNEMIKELEELVYLGHHQEERRLENSKLELARWTSLSETKNASPQDKASEEATEQVSASSVAKKKTSKKIKKAFHTPYRDVLNTYYEAVQFIHAKKAEFIKQANALLLPKNHFQPIEFLKHCRENSDILSELSFDESENIILKFFGQFSICRNPAEQALCIEIAELLSMHISCFKRHMQKQSICTYDIFGFRISGLIMAFLNNNVPYWEYMHALGMSFADNRHIIYDGFAGNILHAILLLLNEIPKEQLDSLIPFVHRLFHYLEEDGTHLRNMKIFKKILTSDRKLISSQSFFKKHTGKQSVEAKIALQQFKAELLSEPYGTIAIMDAIELWLIRAQKNWTLGLTQDRNAAVLMPKLVELMISVSPFVNFEIILQSFQRLLALQPLGMFDDHSCFKLLGKAELPPLDLLSDFSLVYVGAEYQAPISQLLNFFISTLTERGLSMSNSMLTHLMQSYFSKSQACVVSKVHSTKLIAPTNMASTDERAQFIIQINEKLTYARIAYFLFTIKAKQGLFLTHDDYRVMLHFNQCYLGSEVSRFEKNIATYQHQRRVCINIMEASKAAIDCLELSEEVKTPLLASTEYQGLMGAYQNLMIEIDKEKTSPAKTLTARK